MASEETTPAEQINRALDEGKFLGEFPDLPEGAVDLPQTVPLTIYIGTEKFIIGTATVLGRKVHAQIKPADGRQLERLVTEGLITGVSVYFDKAGPAVPAHPVLPFQNEKTEPKPFEKYNFDPTDPMKRIPDIEKIKIDNVPEGLPKIKGLRVTHEIVDEITHTEEPQFTEKIMTDFWNRDLTLETEEPWEDKFPYGKA